MIAFIEFNFTFHLVAFLVIRKTWDDQFAGKVMGWEFIKKWGGMILKLRVREGVIPLTDYETFNIVTNHLFEGFKQKNSLSL